MNWLADNRIRLNVCPTSNVMLGAVADLESHPIRALYDHGVDVTINTDDLMIFGQSVSDEYLNLYRAGVFTGDELEEIRLGFPALALLGRPIALHGLQMVAADPAVVAAVPRHAVLKRVANALVAKPDQVQERVLLAVDANLDDVQEVA